jgi:hypothetical protein
VRSAGHLAVVVIVSIVVLIVLAPHAEAGSVRFDLTRIQYHRGDALVFEGRASANASVHVQVYNGRSRDYSNYSKANGTGYWIHGIRVNETWPDGTRSLYVTDMATGDFWQVEIEIVPTWAEITDRIEGAQSAGWNLAFGIVMLVVVLAVFSSFVVLGYAAFKTRRLTLGHAIGRLGAFASAWSERTWWQLTMTFHMDANALEGTRLDRLSLRSRRAAREDTNARRDIEEAQAMIRTAEDTIVRADLDRKQDQDLYETIAEQLRKPGAKRRQVVARVLKETQKAREGMPDG